MRAQQTIQTLMLSLLLLAASGASAAQPHSLRKPKKKSDVTSPTSYGKHGAKVKKSSRHKDSHQSSQKAPTSERISEIQSALSTQGAYQGDSTGRWDGDTVDAMKKFQSQNGLNPSGKLDAHTLQKLGLGSDTAGRGAPMPQASPSANLRTSSLPGQATE